MVDNVTLAVTVVGTLVLFSGLLILIGAVAMTKFRRVYEAAIFKTLGATRQLIATVLFLEYGLLGLLAGGDRRRWCHRLDVGHQPVCAGDSVPAADRAQRRWRRRHGALVAVIGVISSWEVLQRTSHSRRCGQNDQSPVSGCWPDDGEPAMMRSCQTTRWGRRSTNDMNVSSYKDALLKKRIELDETAGLKPLTEFDGAQ